MNLDEIKAARKPRTALSHEQFFDLVQWLRLTGEHFSTYAEAARSASRHLGFEVAYSTIKPAMAKAGVDLSQPPTDADQLRRDLAIVATALLASGASPDFEFRLRKIIERNSDPA